MATFIGASQGGVFGSLLATLGVVLPSFVIILLIAALLRSLLKYAGVSAFLSGVRPCVVALILATAVTMGLSTLLGLTTLDSGLHPNWQGLIIFALVAAAGWGWRRWKGRAPSPIALILFSAGLGVLLGVL